MCVFVSTAVSAQLCVCVCLCQRPNRCALYPFAVTESQLVSTYTLQKHHEYLVFRCFLFGFQTFVHYTLYIIHYISYKHARSDPTWEIGQHAKSGGGSQYLSSVANTIKNTFALFDFLNDCDIYWKKIMLLFKGDLLCFFIFSFIQCFVNVLVRVKDLKSSKVQSRHRQNQPAENTAPENAPSVVPPFNSTTL